ncbi:hypothetical protein M413DRAFT_375038 [Hebeloma cylindrosporum]|uniref:Uncharacterized protein n=1 Tax=Hebeloma cylindrosporum TaxID=76867 RepID=A0A0C2Y2S2_HEBCY|nr:hypothetical protein M413DRAFT_375038 [Hebeloma cylindrosporum h7]
MLQSRPIPHPRREQPSTQRPNQARRITAFFASIRKNASVPSRPVGLYQGGNGLYHPPPHDGRPAYVSHPHSHRTLPPANSVSPHIIGWTRVADSVVGPHPNAQPLSSRIATQAEINMISGHVHIPWAYNDASGRPPPIPVKVQKPVTAYQQQFTPTTSPTATASARTPTPQAPLKDVGNLRAQGRAIFGTVNHAARGSASKGKGVRQPRGKENTPPALSSFATRRD